MKKISKVTMVISKFIEILHWIGAALSVLLALFCFFDKGGMAEMLSDEQLQLNMYGLESGILDQTGEISITAFRIVSIMGVIIMSLMAMTFRNVYLIVKRSKDSTPFQKCNVRMIKEIGIFTIAIPIIKLITSIIIRIVLGSAAAEISVNISGFMIGILVLCLMQFFAHGVELEEEVDGLV